MRQAVFGLLCGLGACLLSLQAQVVQAQVVQISAGSSSAADTQGGSVAVYSAGATTRVSLGSAGGLRLGFSREVETSNSRLTAGDTTPSLDLLTDGGQTRRTVYGRGTRLQLHGGTQETEFFAGRSGAQRGNALFTAVLPDKRLLVVNTVQHSGPLSLQALLVRGDTSASLASVSSRLGAHTTAALTAGWNEHKLIVRGWAHSAGATWRVDVSDTSGHLRLQPSPQLLQFEAEQIGLNVALSKRFGNRLQVDAARHEYATSAADGQSTNVVLGARSILWEAGTTARTGSLQTGVRGIMSQNVHGSDGGVAVIAGWHRPRWDSQATVLTRGSAAVPVTTTVQLDAGERLTRYVRVEQGMRVGTGMPAFDVGGAMEGNWGPLRVTHGETYVPYGPAVGFRRVLTVAAQWHVRNGTVQLARVSASGIASEYDGSVTDYEGSGTGAALTAVQSRSRMPKYRVQGVVRDADGFPVAGAAVAVGSQTVYADSEGHWMARFAVSRVVRVSLQPSEFLTSTRFEAATPALMAEPSTAAADLELKVSRCSGARPEEAVAAVADGMDEARPPSLWRPVHAAARVLLRMARFWAR